MPDLSRIKEVIFTGKPRREFKANANTDDVKVSDPKRVHQALREFNDLSASDVFTKMLQQIAQLESENPSSTTIVNFDENPEEVIKNVERMLEKEKASSKAATKVTTINFDLNEG